MPSLAGRAAVVTGAAHGIGRGTAELLQALGARVVGVDRDARALDELVCDHGCAALTGDLAGDRVEELAEEIWAGYGPIDLVVNNVGVDPARRFFDIDPDEFDLVLGTNLRGPWFFTKRLAQHLIDEGRGGAIVFVSSLHDHRVHTHAHYSASKAAVSMLVKELAAELGPHGIRVNAVSPGIVNTHGNPVSEDSPSRRLVPLGRIGAAEDIAHVTAMLLSDEWCAYVTGANVPVDGGLDLYSWSTANGLEPRKESVVGRLRRAGLRWPIWSSGG